jgi:hypothetical protein
VIERSVLHHKHDDVLDLVEIVERGVRCDRYERRYRDESFFAAPTRLRAAAALRLAGTLRAPAPMRFLDRRAARFSLALVILPRLLVFFGMHSSSNESEGAFEDSEFGCSDCLLWDFLLHVATTLGPS